MIDWSAIVTAEKSTWTHLLDMSFHIIITCQIVISPQHWRWSSFINPHSLTPSRHTCLYLAHMHLLRSDHLLSYSDGLCISALLLIGDSFDLDKASEVISTKRVAPQAVVYGAYVLRLWRMSVYMAMHAPFCTCQSHGRSGGKVMHHCWVASVHTLYFTVTFFSSQVA